MKNIQIIAYFLVLIISYFFSVILVGISRMSPEQLYKTTFNETVVWVLAVILAVSLGVLLTLLDKE